MTINWFKRLRFWRRLENRLPISRVVGLTVAVGFIAMGWSVPAFALLLLLWLLVGVESFIYLWSHWFNWQQEKKMVRPLVTCAYLILGYAMAIAWYYFDADIISCAAIWAIGSALWVALAGLLPVLIVLKQTRQLS